MSIANIEHCWYPKVSIVVPVYNVEQYFDRCIQSLLSQTIREVEIILVDDGSPDNCGALCDEYARQDSRISVVHKQNAGLGMACNSGLEVATGKYVAFCDSDDWVDRDMYRRMYEEAESHAADVIYTGLKRVRGNGDILGYMNHPQNREEIEGDGISPFMMDFIASAPKESADHNIQVSAKVALYRRETLEVNHIRFVSEREFPSEDLIFNIQVLCKANKVVVLPVYFYNYFVNDNSITTTFKPNHYKRLLETAKLIKSFAVSRCGESVDERIGRFLIGEARSHGRQIVNSSLTDSEKKDKIRELSAMVTSNEFVCNYPVRKMPIKHRIMHFAICVTLTPLVRLLYSIG